MGVEKLFPTLQRNQHELIDVKPVDLTDLNQQQDSNTVAFACTVGVRREGPGGEIEEGSGSASVDPKGMRDGAAGVELATCLAGCDSKHHRHFFEIDLFGAHLHNILEEIHTSKDGALPFDVGVRFGKEMARRYGRHFSLYHVDGGRSKEKEETHHRRAQAKEKEEAKLEKDLVLLEKRCQEGKSPCKTLVGNINRLLKRIYRITDQFKAEFVKGMRESGLLVCCCTTEADLCIARRADSVVIGGLMYMRVVVTNDSDSLVYKTIGRVLRKMPRSPGYGLYIKSKTMDAFKLPSIGHVAVLGVVGTNDYSSSLEGHGIATNLAILRTITSSSDPYEILQAYMQHVQSYRDLSQDYFDNASRVFLDLIDTPLDTQQSPTNSLYPTACQRIASAYQHRRQVVHQKRTLSSELGPIMYRRPGSKRNPYKPVFETKDTMLTGRVIEDISAREERDEPKPTRARKPYIPKPPDPEKDKANKEKKEQAAKARKEKREKEKQRKAEEKKEKAKNQKPRNLSESTAADRELRRMHPLRSLPVGSTRACVARQLVSVYGGIFVKNLLFLGQSLPGSRLTSERADDLKKRLPSRLGNLEDKNGAFYSILQDLQAIFDEPSPSTISQTLNASSLTPLQPLPIPKSSVGISSPASNTKNVDPIALLLQASASYSHPSATTTSLESRSTPTPQRATPASTDTEAMTDAERLRKFFRMPTIDNDSSMATYSTPTVASSIEPVSYTSLTGTPNLSDQQRSNLKSALKDQSFITVASTRIRQAARDDSEIMAQELQSATDLCNTLQVYAYMAVALFIRAVLECRPLPPCPPVAPLDKYKPTYSNTLTSLQIIWPKLEWKPEDSKVRAHLLNLVVTNKGFFDSLGSILYTGTKTRASRNKEAAGFLSPSDAATIAFGFFVEATNVPPCQVNRGLSGTFMTSMAMTPVFTAVKRHYTQDEDQLRSWNLAHIDLFFLRKTQPALFDPPGLAFSDFPKSALKPGYIYFTEPALKDVFYANPDTKRIVDAIVDYGSYPGALSENYTGYNNAMFCTERGLLIDLLFGHHGYSDKKVSIVSDNRSTRYKFKGSMQTNGLVINRLAFDTTERRYPTQQSQHQQTSCESNSSSSSNTSKNNTSNNNDDDDSLDSDVPDSMDDDLQLLDDDGEDGVVESQDQDTFVDNAGSDVPREWTRWTAGTKLLPNVQTTFSSPSNCPDPSSAFVIGWDAGEVNSGVMSAKDPLDPDRRHTLKIKRSFLWRPAIKFREDVEQRKKEKQAWARPDGIDSIAELERNIPSFSFATLDAYFNYLRSRMDSTTSTTALDALLGFYRQKWYRRKQWASSQAQRSSLDQAVDAILRMADKRSVSVLDSNLDSVDDYNCDSTRSTSQGPLNRTSLPLEGVVVCIGLASFNSRSGLPSKHAKLIRHFVKRARPLGVTIVGCNEYFTSAKCPRQDCDEFLMSLPNRSKYCGSCRMHFDRDAVGAENIATICQSQLQHQCRPPKFMPKPQEPSLPPPAPPAPPPATPSQDASGSSHKSKRSHTKVPISDNALILRVQKRPCRSSANKH